jgi:CRP/FNR family cyclic AMP-dependent transcriptional regulator
MTSQAQTTAPVRRVAEPPSLKVDLAAYLPRKPIKEFFKKGIVYSPQQPSHSLYLVVSGRVKVSTLSGGEIACSIVHKGGLFGEKVLVDAQQRSDSAVALDPVTLMAWSRGEIEQQLELNPRLGLAFSRYLARHCEELAERMKTMVVHRTPERVMLALLQFAREAGVRTAGGSTRVESLTHQTLAEYVGTSREVVTFQLNSLRKLGLLSYNRKYIDISVEGLEEAIRQASPRTPEKLHKKGRAVAG